MNWKAFCKAFCKKSWKKNNTWNITHLVDDSFVPSSQWPSVIYQILTDFKYHSFWSKRDLDILSTSKWSSVKNIYVVGKKMIRNGHEMAIYET